MTESDPVRKKAGRSGSSPLVLTLLALAAFVLLMVMMVYLGNRLRTIEDQLHYSPPQISAHPAADTYSIDVVDAQTVYVPVYSHIYSEGGEPHLLETTLSIRNSDPQRSITVTSVRYFDTKGELIQEYLKGSLTLGPLETKELLVEKRDTRGGSGANFIVAWKADEAVYEPIIEALMVGLTKNQSISFKSPGRPLAERIEK